MSWTVPTASARLEVAFQQLQQAAKPLRSPCHERKDDGELRDLALTGADPAGALRPPRRCQLLREIGSPFSSAALPISGASA